MNNKSQVGYKCCTASDMDRLTHPLACVSLEVVCQSIHMCRTASVPAPQLEVKHGDPEVLVVLSAAPAQDPTRSDRRSPPSPRSPPFAQSPQDPNRSHRRMAHRWRRWPRPSPPFALATRHDQSHLGSDQKSRAVLTGTAEAAKAFGAAIGSLPEGWSEHERS